MRKLLGLLQPGGILALSLRHGPPDSKRSMHPVSLPVVERLAREHGAIVASSVSLQRTCTHLMSATFACPVAADPARLCRYDLQGPRQDPGPQLPLPHASLAIGRKLCGADPATRIRSGVRRT